MELDVLLINPPGGHYAERWKRRAAMPPLGLAYLAAAARRAGFAARILDAAVSGGSAKEMEEAIRKAAPRTIGVTCSTENRFAAAETVRAARRVAPGAWIVMGGPHASADARGTLENIPELDAVIRGEGEVPLAAALDFLHRGGCWEDVPSLTWRCGGTIVANPGRTAGVYTAPLDELPPPARDLLPMDKYRFFLDVPGRGRLRAAHVMTSRGCPWRCRFCIAPVLFGHRPRAASPERVVAEVAELRDRFGAGAVWFFDDTFTFDPDRVARICELMLSSGLDMPWFCEIRAGSCGERLLRLMRRAGCFSVGIGIESGDDRVLERTGKGISAAEAEATVRLCDRLGIRAVAFFILGHPGETMDEAERTLALAERLPASCERCLSLMRIYPGTEIERLALAEGALPADFSWWEEGVAREAGLAACHGLVPIYTGNLSWEEVGRLLARWSRTNGAGFWRRAWRAILSVRSLHEAGRLARMAAGCLGCRPLKSGRSGGEPDASAGKRGRSAYKPPVYDWDPGGAGGGSVASGRASGAADSGSGISVRGAGASGEVP
ncbi:MAG: B12-binding domain-containing radical SAM protein [Planctomycetota bacterium]|nr:B12-binding domain-containing radical SAM protein [Planctomycetota bacterium]